MKTLIALSILISSQIVSAEMCTFSIRDQKAHDYESFSKSLYSEDAACAEPAYECRQKLTSYQSQDLRCLKTSGKNFVAPLETFQETFYDSKGVTFSFNEKMKVRAPQTGKIVYVGILKNFGNVVMINHMDNSRSVLLGQFDPTVKVGEFVTTSQTIGHTNLQSQNAGRKIYFEVRKHNLVQNTFPILDKNTLFK